MPRVILLALVASLVAPVHRVAGDEIVISTGADRGSYYYIGSRLRTELMVEYNQPAELKTSHGSLANLAALADPANPINVALTQTDALDQYLAKHPEFAETFFVLGDVGRECAFVATAKRSGVETATELIEMGGEISIGDVESGAAVTWQSLTRLDPALAALEPVSVPTMEALLQLKVGADYTKLSAALWVQRPRRTSPPIETVIGDRESYQLVAIRPEHLATPTLPDGSAVYTFERVAVGKERSAPLAVETLCTRGLMLGAKGKLTTEQRERLSTLMLDAANRIVGADE